MNLLIDLFWMAMAGGSRAELAFPDKVRPDKETPNGDGHGRNRLTQTGLFAVVSQAINHTVSSDACIGGVGG